MNVLVVFAHPRADSYVGSIHAALVEALRAEGHEVVVLDLYAQAFDPVLDSREWQAHRDGRDAGGLVDHTAALMAAEALVFIYPTWWYGPPAILKGWLDRVWRPGVAFSLEGGVFRTHYLPRIRRFAVLTTYGSPRRFIEWGVGDPARRQFMRGLALQFARGRRAVWARRSTTSTPARRTTWPRRGRRRSGG